MESAAKRIRTHEARACESGARVLLWGRVFLDAERVLLRDSYGEIPLEGISASQADVLEVVGTWSGSTLLVESHRVLAQPTSGGLRATSDALRLHPVQIERLRKRAALLRSLHGFFEGQDFLHLETPNAVISPGLDRHVEAFSIPNMPVPGRDAPGRYLITSPEYHMKRALSAGLERIYQVSRCYRREELGPNHQPEFTMLEWYRSPSHSNAIMRDTEELVAHVATAINARPILRYRGKELDVTPPWDRMRVEEAFQRFAGVSAHDLAHDEEAFFRVCVEELEPKLGHERPIFLTHWPAKMASLARMHPKSNPPTADRFEAYVFGIELCNGFGELVDAQEQRARLEAEYAERARLNETLYPIDEAFLGALEDGLPGCSGNALGIDRLVMLCIGADSLDEVLAFPAGTELL